ncbi:MAG: hypothetical protein A2020_16430 [Lentisphaerae bacterium GWF2_45_14]|nr:MAG: hypothetical protein A2020_16430 [Lentisphaerae bacterium GWF2_45_14]
MSAKRRVEKAVKKEIAPALTQEEAAPVEEIVGAREAKVIYHHEHDTASAIMMDGSVVREYYNEILINEEVSIKKPTVIYRDPDICPLCDSVDSFVTVDSRKLSPGLVRRKRRCRRCGHVVDERTNLKKRH